MSFILQDEQDRLYIQQLRTDIKILNRSRIDWTHEDVNRFGNLLNIDEPLAALIREFDIDGAKLFDLEHLEENL